MISFLKYNFCLDGNCVDAVPTNVQNITKVEIENGIYDHFNINSNTTNAYNSTIPLKWESSTIINANFAGHTNGGDLEATVKDIQYVLIKRRKSGTYNWVTIKKVRITEPDDLYFAFNDYLVTPGRYEYAFVPLLKSGIEGVYITQELDVSFNGMFVCDINSIYKFYSNVQFTGTTQAQKVKTYEPFGRKYPIYIANSKMNYQKGRLSATVLNSDYMNTRRFDRNALREMRDAFVQFLTNKKAKIIKDWNGNAWMVAIVDDVGITFSAETDNALADVAFNYVEIGEVDNQEDMELNGLIEEI